MARQLSVAPAAAQPRDLSCRQPTEPYGNDWRLPGRTGASARLGRVTIDLDTTPVEPTPRLRLRTRRSRWLLAGVAVAVVAAAAVAVVLGGSPPPATPPPDVDGQLRWVASLVDARPRGSLAADVAFTRELAERIAGVTSVNGLVGVPRNPATSGRLHATLLFAEDIDDYRVALLSLRNPEIEEDRRRYALTYVLWLYGPRGASVDALVQPVVLINSTDEAGYVLEAAAPVTSALIGAPEDPLWVLLAPPRCELATAPAADLTDWTPESGDYLVRRPAADGPLYWRATCQGVVREEAPVPRPALTERDVDRLMASAEGEPDRERLLYQASHLAGVYGSELLDLGRVLWSGDVALSPKARIPDMAFALVRHGDGGTEVVDVPIDTTITVLAAPRARGGWIGLASTLVRASPEETWGIDDTTFTTPANPHGLIAVQLERWHGQVLVLGRSPRVASVRLVDADGAVLDESTMDDRPVMLAPGRDTSPAGLHIAALDATGATVATVELAETNAGFDRISDWDS